jgi:hypothetical protein
MSGGGARRDGEYRTDQRGTRPRACRLTPRERLLLTEKAREGTRRCWPGMDVLVKRMGLSERRVCDVLAGLVCRNLIRFTKHCNPACAGPPTQ